MADLFLSYKSEDRNRVKPLVAALEADGLTVWWDAQIEGGAGWRQRIEQELAAAKCVVVAWTKRSVGPEGEFVHDEATRAKKRGAYLPVLLDAVNPPLGFGETQALPLVGWKGDRADARYQAVLAAARSVVSGPVRAGGAQAKPSGAGPAVGRRGLIGGGIALGAVALAGGGWWLWQGGADAKAEDSIAVLPFANLSGDPEQAYFSDGIAEELRASLSRIAELKVAARTSSEVFRDSADVKKAARELGVANVLVGSVRRSADTVRVSAQLVDGANGLEKWSESYDRPAGDELAIQTGIAESVAGALKIRFGGAERAALQLGGTNVPAAQDALLRARAILGGDEDSYRRWLAEIDAALAADPKFATAHAARAMGVAGHASQSLGSGAKRAEAMASAQASADQAIRLAPLFPYAHSAFGYVREVQLDMAGAYRAYRHALTLPGSDARTLNNISGFLGAMGRTDEALQINARGIALDPLEPRGKQTKAGILLDAERYAEGLALLRQLPADRVPHVWIGNSLVLMGRPKEAIGEFEQVSTEWMRLQGLAIARARTGDRAAADKALAAFRAIDDGSLDYQFVQLHAQRGEIELAIAALERAWVKRDPGLAAMKGDPLLKPLRGDPRFQAVQAKLNFP